MFPLELEAPLMSMDLKDFAIQNAGEPKGKDVYRPLEGGFGQLSAVSTASKGRPAARLVLQDPAKAILAALAVARSMWCCEHRAGAAASWFQVPQRMERL